MIDKSQPCCASAALAEQQVASVEAPVPAVQTLTPAVPVSVSLPQPQAAMPITVQGCPQVRPNLHAQFTFISSQRRRNAFVWGLKHFGTVSLGTGENSDHTLVVWWLQANIVLCYIRCWPRKVWPLWWLVWWLRRGPSGSPCSSPSVWRAPSVARVV